MIIHKRTSSRLLVLAICLLFISPAVGATELEAKSEGCINTNNRIARDGNNPRLRRKRTSSSNQDNANHQVPREQKNQKKTSKETRSEDFINTDQQGHISSLKRPGDVPVVTKRDKMNLRLMMKHKKIQRLNRETFWCALGGACVMGASVFSLGLALAKDSAMAPAYNKGAGSQGYHKDLEDYNVLSGCSLIGPLVGMACGAGIFLTVWRRAASGKK